MAAGTRIVSVVIDTKFYTRYSIIHIVNCSDTKRYEEGGFFQEHRDTEKENGMFATLVIILPSEFEGISNTLTPVP